MLAAFDEFLVMPSVICMSAVQIAQIGIPSQKGDNYNLP